MCNRTLWDYTKSNDREIKVVTSGVDLPYQFNGLDDNQPGEKIASQMHSIMSAHIPIKLSSAITPWRINKLKTDIKRKHRVFGTVNRREITLEDLDLVKAVRNDTLKIIANAKVKHLMTLGRTLADQDQGPKRTRQYSIE